ncbi:MAG: aminotransferase class I/II-fold pyridoxal phosphate-dependent enzyme [Chitinophagaceae bacterium]
MKRRHLIKRSAIAIAAFTFSRDLFAREAEETAAMYGFTDYIKLSSNENPHGPSSLAKKAMMDAVNGSNRYPWEVTARLQEKIGAQFNLKKENVIIGAGSSELLGVVSTYAALKKGNAIAPDPTFRLWIPAAKKAGLDIKLVALDNNKVTDLQKMKDQIDTNTQLIYICNPNNPTGTIIPAAELEAFIKQVPSRIIILLDEAYTEFSDEPSMARLVNDYPNLVVAKTFSKVYGMAGARVGFGLAHPSTVKQLNDMQPWANAGASAVSLAGAVAVVQDNEFITYCKTQNQIARKIFTDVLTKKGIKYIPSHTSFVYFDPAGSGKDVTKILETNQIIGARTFEPNSSWLRLSVGNVEEMTRVAQVLNA